MKIITNMKSIKQHINEKLKISNSDVDMEDVTYGQLYEVLNNSSYQSGLYLPLIFDYDDLPVYHDRYKIYEMRAVSSFKEIRMEIRRINDPKNRSEYTDISTYSNKDKVIDFMDQYYAKAIIQYLLNKK